VIGQILQETYRVERLIGKGTMGVVYEASHLRFSRRFAIKVLSPTLTRNREAMARFRQEAEITASLGHPHILQVVDFNTFDGCPYIVMELLVGENLGERMTRDKRMPVAAVSSIFSQAASALDAVHQHGVVHRDLKPSNIFLCYDGRADDFVRVLDFGISKVLGAEEGLTGTGAVLGSPQYMAPEQALGRSAAVDRRTDVYATGAILYEMLAGQAPFEGADTLPELLEQIVGQRPAPIPTLRPGLPSQLDRVIARALEKEPADRFDTMADFWVAFEDALGRSRRGADLSVSRVVAADLATPRSLPAPTDPETIRREPWKKRQADVSDGEETVVDGRPPLMPPRGAFIVGDALPRLAPGATDNMGYEGDFTLPGGETTENPMLDEPLVFPPGPAPAPRPPARLAGIRSALTSLPPNQRLFLLLLLAVIIGILGIVVGIIIWVVGRAP
jgi:eukaryotic-like serine/threonine-protein kinase